MMNYCQHLFIPLLFAITGVFSLHAEGPDEQTQALIEKLGLEEADEPVRNSPVWRKPDKVYITMPTPDPEQ